MSEIEWSSGLEVGHYAIDSQHMMFIDIINRLFSNLEPGFDRKCFEMSLQELLKYADFHFCSEEVIMLENNYPDYESHKNEHQELMLQLRSLLSSISFESKDFQALKTFLIEWFQTHTVTVDKELALYIQEQQRSCRKFCANRS